LNPSYTQYLKVGNVNDNLEKEFEDRRQFLSTEAKVSKIDDKQWKIEDGEMQYRIEDTEKRLDIYKKKNK
jgi:hypothetical protein